MRLPHPTTPSRTLGLILAITLVDALVARAAIAACAVQGVAPVWPSAGVALAVLLWGGRRLWPAVLAGSLAGNLLSGAPLVAAAGSGVSGAVEAVIAATILLRLRADVRCPRQRDALALLCAAAVGALVAAPLGTVAMTADGLVDLSLPHSTLMWGMGDVLGMLLTAPLLMTLLLGPTGAPRRAGAGERVAALGVLAAGLIFAATAQEPATAYAVPAMLWIAARQGPASASLAGLASALTLTGAAAHGLGPWDGGAADVLHIQYVAGLLSTVMVLMAAATTERLVAQRSLAAIAAEDAALRRVATTVASGAAPGDALATVAREMAALLEVHTGVVARFDGDAHARVLALWSSDDTPQPLVGERIALAPGSAVDQARQGRLGRFDERDAETLTLPPFRLRVAAPIIADGRPWGALIASSVDRTDLPASTESRLERFAELAGLTVQLADERDRLVAEATTDPLTGLLNHRAFHERLRQACAAARRRDRPLSMALFDLDRFKQVNDTLGHLAGDRVLAEAARRMHDATRSGEVIARLGGDELALLMVDTPADEAHAAAERIRRAITAEPFGDAGHMTISAGVCDLGRAGHADDLLRLADGALYWAKANGRDACIVYSPEVVEELSAAERADRLEHARALAALGALAKAIDAKDPATIRHSERVAALTAELAGESGWSADEVGRLHDAALVHDVGKIGVPDAILSKPGRLTDEEYDVIKRHADLGARIVAGVLEADQVAWVRGHHERHDGRGYPDGLAGAAIPDGARLLALADAWDAMTGARVYSAPMPLADALAEVRRNAGTQFHPEAVQALERIHARDGLAAYAPAMALVQHQGSDPLRCATQRV
jgi:diguanylate cyclase (GGDEF)-like protein